jgi:perosamine synthetase
MLGATAAALGMSPTHAGELERDIARSFDARATLLTDSGTSALVLALRATVPRAGIVAFPAYACVDLSAAAVRAEVRVLLYDVDPETLSPDLESVRSTLSEGARALVVAPLYGYPQDMLAVAEMASGHGVPLIEDAAQRAGGTFNDRTLGAFGDLSVLSFGRGKGTTAGAGGALLVRQASYLEWARETQARLRSRDRGAREIVTLAAQWVLARPSAYAIPASIPWLRLGETVYRRADEPRALSMASAGALRGALAADAAETQTRRVHAATLRAATSRTRRFVAVRPLDRADPGYLRFAILDVEGNASANTRLGAVRGYPRVLNEYPEARQVLVERRQSLTGAKTLRDRLFTLPTHSRMSAADVSKLGEWLGSSTDRSLVQLTLTRPN